MDNHAKVGSALLACLLYFILLVTYRLFFHPLSGFPGSKLAASSKWYEFVFDVFIGEGGSFMHEIRRMHEQYGPIIRINPDELHVEDPLWYDNLYAGGNAVRDKYPPAAAIGGVPRGIHGTVLHSEHRMRRQAITSFFSKHSTIRFLPQVKEQIDLLFSAMLERHQKDGHVRLNVLFAGFANDVASEFLFGGTRGMSQDYPKALEWKETISKVGQNAPVARQFPWMIPLTKKVPMSVMGFLSPEFERVINMHEEVYEWARKVMSTRKNPSTKDEKEMKRPHTLFDEILDSDLPPAEKDITRLGDDGIVVIGAAGETVSRVLSTATFHLLNQEWILKKLLKEMAVLMPTPDSVPSLLELEKLPWLTAIIKESLRISAVLTSRLAIVSPEKPLTYGDWVIPAGAPTSMTIHDVLLDPSVFPDPQSFKPQRWLEGSEQQLKTMNKCFVPFSRGSRMCIGTNLAYAELYLVLSKLFSRFELSLYDTVHDRDVKVSRDCFLAEARKGSLGVRIQILKDKLECS